ncbi:MAG: hypothetical protein AABW51_03595 [Nanoarchaeota archaeon]
MVRYDSSDFASKIELLMMLYNSREPVHYQTLLKMSSSDRNLLAEASVLSGKGLVDRLKDPERGEDDKLTFALSDNGRKYVEDFLKQSYNMFGLFLQ